MSHELAVVGARRGHGGVRRGVRRLGVPRRLRVRVGGGSPSRIQPRGGAFSIWIAIYTLLLVAAPATGAAFAARRGRSRRRVAAPDLRVGDCGARERQRADVRNGRAARPRRRRGVDCRRAGAVRPSGGGARAWAAEAGVGLYAGWLLAATAINAASAARRSTPPRLAAVAGVAGAASVGLARPWPCASLVWAIACSASRRGPSRGGGRRAGRRRCGGVRGRRARDLDSSSRLRLIRPPLARQTPEPSRREHLRRRHSRRGRRARSAGSGVQARRRASTTEYMPCPSSSTTRAPGSSQSRW